MPMGPHFIYLQHFLTFDGLLALWVTASLAAGHTALTGRRHRWHWWLLSALACGLGILTKGPVGVHSRAGANSRLFLSRLSLSTSTAPGDMGRVPRSGGRCCGALVNRGVLSTTRVSQRIPVATACHPFSSEPSRSSGAVLVLPALDCCSACSLDSLVAGTRALLTAPLGFGVDTASAALGFLLLAALGGLVFFSASGCKRAVYILPVMPPLALALGCYVDIGARQAHLEPDRPRSQLATRAPGWCWPAPSGALDLGCVSVAAGRDRRDSRRFVSRGDGLLWRMRTVSWVGCAVATLRCLVGAVQFLLPAYNEQFACAGQPLGNVGDHRWDGERLTGGLLSPSFRLGQFLSAGRGGSGFRSAQREQMLRRLADRAGGAADRRIGERGRRPDARSAGLGGVRAWAAGRGRSAGAATTIVAA